MLQLSSERAGHSQSIIVREIRAYNALHDIFRDFVANKDHFYKFDLDLGICRKSVFQILKTSYKTDPFNDIA